MWFDVLLMCVDGGKSTKLPGGGTCIDNCPDDSPGEGLLAKTYGEDLSWIDVLTGNTHFELSS